MFFDCDSTLSSIEGIDELAHAHRDQVIPLTEAAMRGEVSLESVYGRRLAIIRPSRGELERIGALYVSSLIPGATETIAALQRLGVEVHIISGGLRPAVLHVARVLGVPTGRVHAVDIRFDDAGDYAGYDENSPLARQGGKPALIQALGSVPRPSMLVGDGATDLEARSAVDTFVAFAGVEVRPLVVAGADAVIYARSLLPVLTLALGDNTSYPSELQSLIDQGQSLLDVPVSLSPSRTSP